MNLGVKYKVMAWVLTLCLTITLIPELSFGAETSAQTGTQEQQEAALPEKAPELEEIPEVTKEDVVEKTEDTTTYAIGDDQKMTVFHGGEVRYENEKGKLIDYDPSLVKIKEGEQSGQAVSLEGYAYENKRGDNKHYLPETLSEDTPVRMERGDYSIEFSLTDRSLKKTGSAGEGIAVEEETIPTTYEEEKSLPINAVYGTEKEDAIVTYTSGEYGLKETLTLNEQPQSNVFEYQLKLSGMTARKNVTGGGITLYDAESGEITGDISAPWMNDASGEAYSEEISYDLKEAAGKEGEYILTMTAGEDYLSDPERRYPVTIDPSTTWRGSSEIRDAYIISGSYKNTNFYESDTRIMPVGKNSTGWHRTLMRFTKLTNEVKGQSVTSANLTVYETGTGASKEKIGIHRLKTDWSPNTVTWAKCPSYQAAYDTITTKKTKGSAHTFNVLSYAKALADGSVSGYGLMLKSADVDNADYSCFYGSRTTASSYRPKLVVTYYSKPTTATSASISPAYVKASTSAKLTYSGITSTGLARVEYRVDKATCGTTSTTYWGYASTRTISSGAALPSLPNGCYKFYVRGVNQAGTAGTGKATNVVHVDNVAPTIGSVSLKNTAGDSIHGQYTKETNPVIGFSGVTDTHINTSCLSYAIAKTGTVPAASAYKTPANLSISSAKPYSGTFGLTAADQGLATGSYTIYVKAKDTLGNETIKQLSYLKDVSKPTGTLEITEAGTGQETNVAHDTVNIDATLDGTGSPIKTSSLNLFRLTKTTAEDGSETFTEETEPCKEIFQNATVSTNRDLDTTTLKNGYYRLKLQLEDTVGHQNTIQKDLQILNPLDAPTVSTKPTRNGSASITWSMKQTENVKEIQYKLGKDGTWTKGETVSEQKKSGEFTIALPDKEGVYTIFVRALDRDDAGGKETELKCLFDRTAPTVELKKFGQGYLQGTITDTYDLTWRLEIKEKGSEDAAYKKLEEKTEKINDNNLAFIDLGNDTYKKGTEYTLKVTATDQAGNQTEKTFDVYKPADGSCANLMEPDFRIKRTPWQTYTSQEILLPTETTSLSLQIEPGKELDEGTTTWYIDNKLVGEGASYEDDFSTLKAGEQEAKYQENHPYPILVVHETEAGNYQYSTSIIKNGLLKEISLNAAEKTNGTVTEEIHLDGKKAVSFRLAEDLEKGQAEDVTYKIKSGNSEFQEIKADQTYTVASLFKGSVYADSLIVQVTSAADTKLNPVTLELDILKPEQEEHFRLSSIENYRPEKVSVSDKINYKTYITWDNEITANTPDEIFYEVYRGTEKNFTPGPENLAATGIRAGYFSEINVNYKGNFYYQVRAVKKTGDTTEASSYSDQVYSRVVDGNEYTKRMGSKEYWEFAEVELPTGDIGIEKSMGNLVYQQLDAELPNEQLEVELNRTYNSQSTAKSAFGVGWSHDYDIELLKICKGNEINDDNIIMKDGSGTIYHFIRQTDGSYHSSLGKYINLKKEEKTEEITIPARKVGVASGADEKEAISVTSSYTMDTKDNLQYRFNSGGQLVYLQEANGNFLLFEYDTEKGLLSKIITSKNLRAEFVYNQEKESDPLTVKQIKLPDGSVMEYQYEGNPSEENVRLVKAIAKSSKGKEEIEYRYEYDDSEVPNVDRIYDAEGNLYEIKYNAKDQVTEVVYPDQDAVTLSYSETADSVKTADSVVSLENLGLTTTTTTSKVTKGKVVSTESDTFNGYGNCIQSIDAEGYKTQYEYKNNLLQKTTAEVDSHYVDTDQYVKAADPKKTKTELTTYNGDENETTETEEDGSVTSYAYDETAGEYCDDLPIQEQEVNGDGKLIFDLDYTYDKFGNETREYDAVSDTTTLTEYYTQDGTDKLKGEVKKETEYLGTPEDGKLQSVTTYEYSYGNDGSKTEKTTQVCGDDTITTTVVYDNMGREISNTDSRGKKTENIYDGFGRLIKTTYTDGDIVTHTEREYDDNGSLLKETEEDGTVNTYQYDAMNRLISRTVSKGDFSKTWTTSYGYETISIHTGKGNADTLQVKDAFVTTERNPDGEITAQSWQDHLGRIVRELESGIYTDYTYDGQGNILTQYALGQEQTDQKGLLTVYVYDDAGNNTHTVLNPTYETGKGFYTGGEAIVQSSTFDKSGNELTSTDGEGYTTAYTYDEENNITSVTLPDGTVTKYEYDRVNADGTTSDITTDALGRKSEVKKDEGDLEIQVADKGKSNPDPIQTDYEYDAKENVTKETDSEGNYRTYVYDGRDRCTVVNYFDKNGKQTLKTTYAYDRADNITKMCDYTVEDGKETLLRYTTYTYDSLKRLVGMAELDGPDVPTAEEIEKHTLTYIYDIDDNLTEIQYPETGSKIESLKFSYNQHKWLTDVRADTGGILDQKVREYTYGKNGLLLQMKDYKGVLGGSGYVQRDYEYDAFERPVSLEYRDSTDPETIKESYAYTYDKNNNILSEQIRNDYPAKTEERIQEERVYTYDSLGRLLTSTITDQKTGTQTNSSYQYDAVGNRKKETKNGVVTTYEYNDFNQLITSEEKNGERIQSKKSYQYDKNGNQIAEEDTITKESRILGYDAAGNLARFIAKQGDTVAFTQQNKYNGNGQRIQKSEGDQITSYYYQGDAVLYTTDGTGALTAQNLLGTADNVIATTRGTEDAEQYYLYNKDIRESTSNVLNSDGISQVSYQYDEFGETDIRGNQNFYNEICYTGGIYDDTTGLYYLNARYYDPENANFLSQDTYRGEVSDPESLNLYAYCNNNPIVYTDPSGHFPWIAVGIWAYRAYKAYKAIKTAKRVYKTYKTAKKVYKGAKSVKRITSSVKKSSRVVKATKKVTRAYSKPKASKKIRKTVSRSYKPSRLKASQKRVAKKKVSAPKKRRKGWNVGDPITKKTSKGKKPSWSTVRSRYWKNEAAKNPHLYTKKQRKRMKQGKAPQRYNEDTGRMESMELHHKIPRRKGGSDARGNLQKVWPEEHAQIDRYRHVRR